MSDDRCVHEMLPGQCSICRGLPDDGIYMAAALGQRGHRAHPLGAEPDPRTITAARYSTCPWCGGRIEPGDSIVYDDDLDAWLCDRCGQ